MSAVKELATVIDKRIYFIGACMGAVGLGTGILTPVRESALPESAMAVRGVCAEVYMRMRLSRLPRFARLSLSPLPGPSTSCGVFEPERPGLWVRNICQG